MNKNSSKQKSNANEKKMDEQIRKALAKVTKNNKVSKGQSASVNKGKNGQISMAAPVSVGSERTNGFRITTSKYATKYKDAICVEGEEWMQNVNVPATNVPGAVIANFFIQPNEFSSSRLQKFGQIYEKFLFEKLEFDYVPAVNSGTNGSLILAYDRDISDPTPPQTTEGVREYLSWEDTKYGNVWMPHKMDCKLDSPETGFYTDEAVGGDDRLAYQGQFYLAVMNPPATLHAADPLGDIIFKYKCHFFIPASQSAVKTTSVSASISTITADVNSDVWKNLTVANGGVYTPASNYKVIADPGLAKSVIELAEGLYYITQSGQSGALGPTSVTINAPVISPLIPLAPTAPQPLQKVVDAIAASSPASPSTFFSRDDILSIPKGGAKVYGSGTATLNNMLQMGIDVIKLGGYLNDLSAVF